MVIKMAKEKENIWIFKSKREMIVSIILFIIFIICFVILGTKEYNVDSDAKTNIKDLSEYKMVPENNVFRTINASEAYAKVKYSDVIILFGTSNNPWTGYYAKIINEVAQDVGIYEIYYYNFEEDRKNDNGSYQAIVEYFKDNLVRIDGDDLNLYAPILYVKKNNVELLFNEENAIHYGSISAKEEWNDYKEFQTKEELTNIFIEYLGEENK